MCDEPSVDRKMSFRRYWSSDGLYIVLPYMLCWHVEILRIAKTVRRANNINIYLHGPL
jgi:hypothetical protein